MIDYRSHPNAGGADIPQGVDSYDDPNPAPAIIAAPYPDLGIQFVDLGGGSSPTGAVIGPVLPGWSPG